MVHSRNAVGGVAIVVLALLFTAGGSRCAKTCDNRIDGYNPNAIIGYYTTEAEANAARARHVEEAGDR